MNTDDALPSSDDNPQGPEHTALSDDFAGFLGLVNEVAERHVPPCEVERKLRRLMNKAPDVLDGGDDDGGRS